MIFNVRLDQKLLMTFEDVKQVKILDVGPYEGPLRISSPDNSSNKAAVDDVSEFMMESIDAGVAKCKAQGGDSGAPSL
ncbi:hypothetical protein Fmac_028448 [Flemingia macrophylla]|uniref:Uncharacterized protein n=1 Tax=Flemingia macrophylla TaxID=520843 RepID=A0ABD1L7I3_9FABA